MECSVSALSPSGMCAQLNGVSVWAVVSVASHSIPSGPYAGLGKSYVLLSVMDVSPSVPCLVTSVLDHHVRPRMTHEDASGFYEVCKLAPCSHTEKL